VVLVTCLGVLTTVAVTAHTRTTLAQLASQQAKNEAKQRIFVCLSTRAHHLVSADEPVSLQRSSLPLDVLLDGAVASWADVVTDPSSARVGLRVKAGTGPDACGGYILVIRTHP